MTDGAKSINFPVKLSLSPMVMSLAPSSPTTTKATGSIDHPPPTPWPFPFLPFSSPSAPPPPNPNITFETGITVWVSVLMGSPTTVFEVINSCASLSVFLINSAIFISFLSLPEFKISFHSLPQNFSRDKFQSKMPLHIRFKSIIELRINCNI